ncbi:hypothetical protein [Spiroplasma sp. AdecLV25b]|uniref:hypothetical protein n=1 Tax=Spiroplasma sp. AdecLV25b TaxID=3027162 RepID=UPI0027DF0052|nr:hypothetical protein [Spiroplasma sp. AdecLV25b]
MTTESSHHDYFKIKIDNQIQHIRPIYCRTIKFNEITNIWKDFANQPIVLNKNSTFFTKVQEMEIKENLGLDINIQRYKQQENRIANLEKEMEELKKQFKFKLGLITKNANLNSINQEEVEKE